MRPNPQSFPAYLFPLLVSPQSPVNPRPVAYEIFSRSLSLSHVWNESQSTKAAAGICRNEGVTRRTFPACPSVAKGSLGFVRCLTLSPARIFTFLRAPVVFK